MHRPPRNPGRLCLSAFGKACRQMQLRELPPEQYGERHPKSTHGNSIRNNLQNDTRHFVRKRYPAPRERHGKAASGAANITGTRNAAGRAHSAFAFLRQAAPMPRERLIAWKAAERTAAATAPAAAKTPGTTAGLPLGRHIDANPAESPYFFIHLQEN